jgi:hypothetical protein
LYSATLGVRVLLYYKRSTDGGVSFHSPLPLDDRVVSFSGVVASYYDHTVHVAYHKHGEGKLYRRSVVSFTVYMLILKLGMSPQKLLAKYIDHLSMSEDRC